MNASSPSSRSSPMRRFATPLAADALAVFQQHRFDDLVVLNADGTLAGMIDIQDLPKFKIL